MEVTHINDVLSGIVQIMGEHNVGKTSLAFQAIRDPARAGFIDGDEKGREMIEGLRRSKIELGYYEDFVRLQADAGRDINQRYAVLTKIKNRLAAMTDEALDVLIWDNWKPVYDMTRTYIMGHKTEFAPADSWRGDSKIIQGLVSKVARQEEEALLVLMRRKAKLVIVASHLTDQYLNNVKTGAQIPDTSEVFERLCYARFWLRYNPTGSRVPVALMFKNPSEPYFDRESMAIRHHDILPSKITPADGDRSVWDTVIRYYQNPVNNRKLLPEETPTQDEYAMMRGVLTPMQREAWLASVKAASAVVAGDETIDLNLPPVEEKVKELKAEGVTILPIMLNKLTEAGYKVTAPEVMKLLEAK